MIKPTYCHDVALAEIDRLSDGSIVLTLRTLDEADHAFRLSADTFARLIDDADFQHKQQTPPTTQA